MRCRSKLAVSPRFELGLPDPKSGELPLFYKTIVLPIGLEPIISTLKV